MKYNIQTVQALWESSEQWLGNYTTSPILNYEMEQYPLCNLFFKDKCINCPVAIYVSNSLCRNTPLEDVAYQFEYGDDDIAFKEAVIKEYKFLVELALESEFIL